MNENTQLYQMPKMPHQMPKMPQRPKDRYTEGNANSRQINGNILLQMFRQNSFCETFVIKHYH
jgi:hypothetical protein